MKPKLEEHEVKHLQQTVQKVVERSNVFRFYGIITILMVGLSIATFVLSMVLQFRAQPLSKGGTGAKSNEDVHSTIGVGRIGTLDSLTVDDGGFDEDALDLGDVSNHDILPVTHGGTGSTTSAEVRQLLGITNIGTFSGTPFNQGKFFQRPLYVGELTDGVGVGENIFSWTTMWSSSLLYHFHFHVVVRQPYARIVAFALFGGSSLLATFGEFIVTSGHQTYVFDWYTYGSGSNETYRLQAYCDNPDTYVKAASFGYYEVLNAVPTTYNSTTSFPDSFSLF